MPLVLKSRRHIEHLRAAGHLVAETFRLLEQHIRPGVTTAELDTLAEDFIRSHGAVPIYKHYKGPRNDHPPFPGTICASINDVICHGIPNQRARLRQGDIVGIDIGLKLDGWVGDACVTFPVGTVSDTTQKLLDVSKRCLELGIEQAYVGKTLRDVGAAIQKHAEANGFSVVREYTGHGIGRNLHEEPTVLHYDEPRLARYRIMSGMVFTIEPMINEGQPETRLERDRWTVHTADGLLSAQFEHSLAITDDGPVILTI
ncbi:MAG: type I methionyl aminopeptidase [Chloroflexaceae bacterium]|nr:type I methionyl aminopeptidase [Chloroflexaceae bacterium]NJL33038.1 type I methionyl aminopeptidase [Chloroflexaceae bacterium]NJO06845.1 type I methionyl aminopeptidase [Chloroflexaceae bacterium]